MASRRTRVLIVSIALIASLSVGYGLSRLVISQPADSGIVPAIGGSFHLVDEDGKRRSDADFRGKLMLVYFGYTYCPDICPTTLQTMGQALDELGDGADKVAPLFITVDPDRDTPDHLKGYTEQFNPRILGLTGSPQEIADAARVYRVYYRKSGSGFDYLMDHSSIVYLMDRNGHYLTHFTADASADDIATAIAKYL